MFGHEQDFDYLKSILKCVAVFFLHHVSIDYSDVLVKNFLFYFYLFFVLCASFFCLSLCFRSTCAIMWGQFFSDVFFNTLVCFVRVYFPLIFFSHSDQFLCTPLLCTKWAESLQSEIMTQLKDPGSLNSIQITLIIISGGM